MSVIYDPALGATSQPQPDDHDHIVWIAGLGYTRDDLPKLVAFLQQAYRAASIPTQNGRDT